VLYSSFRSPSLFYLFAHSRCRGFLFSLDHTQTHTTVRRTPLDEASARRRDLYLTTQTLYKRQISMPPVRFEPTIPASPRLQTYALDRAATAVGHIATLLSQINPAHSSYPTSLRFFNITDLPAPQSSASPHSLRFHHQILYAFLPSVVHSTRATQVILLDFITPSVFGEEYTGWSAAFCNYLQSPATLSFLSPNIFLNTVFENTLSLCSTLI
jgi:hypothetical protein